MRGNKHQVLLLADKKEIIRPKDLVQRFLYSGGTARSYLSQIARQGLLQRTPKGYVLTDRGKDRLRFFEVEGCPHADCLRCEGKKGKYECPKCGYELRKEEARLTPEGGNILLRWEAGVYCPRCKGRIFTQHQAEISEISRIKDEEKTWGDQSPRSQVAVGEPEKSFFDELFGG